MCWKLDRLKTVVAKAAPDWSALGEAVQSIKLASRPTGHQNKSRPKAAPDSNLMVSDHAAINAAFLFRR